MGVSPESYAKTHSMGIRQPPPPAGKRLTCSPRIRFQRRSSHGRGTAASRLLFFPCQRAHRHASCKLFPKKDQGRLKNRFRFSANQDLAVIFYCLLHASAENQANILIHNHHLNLWKTDKETLYRLAKKNTPQLLPPQLTPMSNLLQTTYVAETPLPDNLPATVRFATNTNHWGNEMLGVNPPDDDILKELSDLFEKDLIILPSSIHEVLILATDENDRQNLDHYTAMVKEVNASQLQDEEILSDHAYYYCRHSHLLTSAALVCTSVIALFPYTKSPQKKFCGEHLLHFYQFII